MIEILNSFVRHLLHIYGIDCVPQSGTKSRHVALNDQNYQSLFYSIWGGALATNLYPPKGLLRVLILFPGIVPCHHRDEVVFSGMDWNAGNKLRSWELFSPQTGNFSDNILVSELDLTVRDSWSLLQFVTQKYTHLACLWRFEIEVQLHTVLRLLE